MSLPFILNERARHIASAIDDNLRVVVETDVNYQEAAKLIFHWMLASKEVVVLFPDANEQLLFYSEFFYVGVSHKILTKVFVEPAMRIEINGVAMYPCEKKEWETLRRGFSADIVLQFTRSPADQLPQSIVDASMKPQTLQIVEIKL